eukprot:5832807-Pyramimonas_sp.AAC.1
MGHSSLPSRPSWLWGDGSQLNLLHRSNADGPCASSIHENDPTFPSAVRDPRQVGQAALRVAVQTGRCMETPLYRGERASGKQSLAQ